MQSFIQLLWPSAFSRNLDSWFCGRSLKYRAGQHIWVKSKRACESNVLTSPKCARYNQQAHSHRRVTKFWTFLDQKKQLEPVFKYPIWNIVHEEVPLAHHLMGIGCGGGSKIVETLSGSTWNRANYHRETPQGPSQWCAVGDFDTTWTNSTSEPSSAEVDFTPREIVWVLLGPQRETNLLRELIFTVSFQCILLKCVVFIEICAKEFRVCRETLQLFGGVKTGRAQNNCQILPKKFGFRAVVTLFTCTYVL